MSAVNINRVTITGNLTRDPELRAVGETGAEVCGMRIAVNMRRKKGEEWVDRANYFDVSVWGGRGRSCEQWLSKGSGVAVDGRLEWREWAGADGVKRQAVEIVADNVQFIGPKGQGSGSSSSEEGDRSNGTPDDGSVDPAPPPEPVAVGAGDDGDDDIPF